MHAGKVNPFENIEGVIWDLDNTLYRFDEDFEKLCHNAAARAALEGGAMVTYEQAMEICMVSYERYGHSGRIFIEEHGLDMAQLHFDFHRFIDERLIRKSLELIGLFERAGLRHALVTHASREWAGRALSHIGLKDFFPDEMIVPAEEVDFSRKSESRVPFEKALALLGLPAHKTAIVEDVAENLRIPYEMGIATALVHYGRPPDPLPDFVQHGCNNAAEFLKTVMADQGAASPLS